MSGAAVIATEEDSFLFRLLSILLILAVFFYELKYTKSVKALQKIFFVLGIGIIFCILELYIYSSTLLGFVLRWIWIAFFVSFIFSKKYKFKHFFEIFYKIILSISLPSLCAFFLVNLFNIGLSYNYASSNGDAFFYKVYLVFFYTAETYIRTIPLSEISVYRIQCFFWEPGVYAIYLVFALFYYIFLKEKQNNFQLIIILITLALTFSTTGICLGILLFSYYLINTLKLSFLSKIIVSIFIVLVALIGIYIVWTTKQIQTSGINGSYYLRSLDFINGITLFIEKPIFGWGYKNLEVFESLQNFGRGNSNGLITLFYNMGIIGGGLTVFPFVYKCILCIKKNFLKEMLFALIFLITNMSEPLIYTPFMIFLIVNQYKLCFEKK